MEDQLSGDVGRLEADIRTLREQLARAEASLHYARGRENVLQELRRRLETVDSGSGGSNGVET